MKENKRLPLIVLEGGREALGRAMLRAHLEHRYEDARALVNRIAYRASLMPVDPSERPDARHFDEIDANDRPDQPGPGTD